MEIDNSSSKGTLEGLKRLQALDKQILYLQGDLRKKPKELSGKMNELEGAKEKCLKKQGEIRELKKKIDSKELDLNTKEEQVKKLEGQLNVVKTNKEYSAIVNEINGLKADNSLLEEEILVFIDELDQLARDAEELEKEVTAKEQDFETESQKNRAEQAELQKELAVYQKERDEMVQHIDPSALETYTRVLEAKGGVAIVPVRGGTCQGCNMAVTSNEISKLMKGDKIISCRTCARIIFLE